MNKVSLKKTSLKINAVKHRSSAVADNQSALIVVGIGTSAGGLEALKLFFDHTPTDTGMAFVIVQHLDPTHKSLLAGLISAHTKMTVKEINDGENILPDSVYVIPPGKGLKVLKQRLFLIDLPKEHINRRPIDSFFQSLAADQHLNARGVILSGTGTEGTLGLKEIKAAGGVTIVQDPKTAHFDGMPKSAIAAGVADYITSPEKMAEQLLNSVNNEGSNSNHPADDPFREIFQIILKQTGYDFSNYKTGTITRKLDKRTGLNQLNTIEDYISFLKQNPEEVNKLYRDFLIGVTSFFRDKAVFKSFEKLAVPYLLEKCEHQQKLRIWVCGCSTGEEAYSLAILFREAIEKNKQDFQVTIFATDIDDEAIAFARRGMYETIIKTDLTPERLRRYFTKTENGYHLKKEIREMVIFAHHDLIKDPPFSKMDLIACRNLLIYIKSELQKKLIPMFHYSLNNDGLLFLGTSESVSEQGILFTAMDEKHKIFKKKNITISKNHALFEMPFVEQKLQLQKPDVIAAVSKIMNVANKTQKHLAESYQPPSVIIDKNNEAVHFSGNMGVYLNLPDGIAKWNILEMAKKGLKPALSSAIKKARKNKTAIKKSGIKIEVSNGFQMLNLNITPLLTKTYDSGMLMITFETEDSTGVGIKDDESSRKRKFKTSDLENELKTTQDDLQTAINDLKISNEDLQSANEELQSTNEELETSREELQSVNEELITVNAELIGKIDQLSQANNDLNNLLRSIEVATVYLDRNLNIKRFTPAATKIFNLIPSDIDRPLTQLSINLYYHTLAEDVTHTLKTLETKTMEVQATDGVWYAMRIIPYRTSENIIEGVLITLVDISSQKMVEHNLSKNKEYPSLIMENLPAVPYACAVEPEIKFSFVGKSCKKVTGFLPEQFIDKTPFWINRLHPDDKNIVISIFSSITKNKHEEHNFRWKCADGKYRQFKNYMSYVAEENGKPGYVAGIWKEISGTLP